MNGREETCPYLDLVVKGHGIIWDYNLINMKKEYGKWLLLANEAIICSSGYISVELQDRKVWNSTDLEGELEKYVSEMGWDKEYE
jgi:flavorubredoxin